ncbi:hypothetical protein JX266_006119 [Neoarthrinium moseri]|nr:hypothetical protein JX266_006119 [Neoarthrinium moseri]
MQKSLIAAVIWLGVVSARLCSESGRYPIEYPAKTNTLPHSSTESTNVSSTSFQLSTQTTATLTSSTTSTSSSTTTITSPILANIVQNSGFEEDDGSLPPWFTITTGNQTMGDTTVAGLIHPGSNSSSAARLYVSVGERNGSSASILQNLPIVTGTIYSISYDIAVSIAEPGEDGAYRCLFLSNFELITIQFFYLSAVERYTRYTTTFVGDSSASTLALSVVCAGHGTGEVELDNLVIAVGK